MRRRALFRSVAGSAVLLLAICLGALGLDRTFPPDLSRLEGLSREVVDRSGDRLRVYLSNDGFYRLPVRITDIDSTYLEMLTAYEDQRYRSHLGVDPLALARAAWQALRHGHVVSGASTLTMQTARLLEHRPRTLGSKLVEMARALQLEHRFSKPEILEIYLTLAPFGGNLEGIQTASWRYFAHPPNPLTAAEAALLVALPQSPSRRRPDRHPAAARIARDTVLARVAAAGVIDAENLRLALAEPVSSGPPAMTMAAPHLADRLLRDHPLRQRIETTIEGPLQRSWERVVRRSVNQLGPAVSAAVLAIDNHTGQTLVYIGASHFNDRARNGAVDVVPAIRSPGSTLKPLIYALAFERGIAHPATMIDDVPTRFGSYAPANFMHRHYGRISLTGALRYSLNVPAVALLDRLGPVAVVERLRRAGAHLSFGDDHAVPGLAFALGGVGTSLADLVGLYAALATDGRMPAIAFTPDPRTEAPGEPLFGATARWYVGEILRGIRPLGTLPDRFRRRSRPLAFKTGTSYGFRDAWAIGYDNDHTVGVWIGRADGTPNPGRFGANTAAPLLFALFDHLPPSGRVAPVRPDHALALDATLPPGLRDFGRDFAHRHVTAASPPPRIIYPVDGTLIALPPESDAITLSSEGGRRPLIWLVNGIPLRTGANRWRARWRPDGIGFNQVVVLDALGRRAEARVRLAAR